MYLLANGLEHAKTACFSSYKTDWLHDNWVMRRQNGFLHSLHFFFCHRQVDSASILAAWTSEDDKEKSTPGLFKVARTPKNSQNTFILLAVKAILFFFLHKRRVSCGSRQSSILFEALSTTQKYDGHCRTWAIMPTFNARKRKDYTEVFQAGKRLSGSEYVC